MPDTGLFSGFEGYRSTTEEDQAGAVREWLVVLDTNVLLGLYQFHGAALQDFVDVFEAIGDRLFVPHQVIDEFWRNRRTVLAENQGKHREPAAIEDGFEGIRTLLRKWYGRVVERAGSPPEAVTAALDVAEETVLGYIRQQTAHSDATGPDTPTHQDRVITLLEPLLRGRIGPAPSRDELVSLTAEGQRRVSAQIPPGYLDAAKGNSRSGGDFLVWHQTMEEAKRRGTPVLLVTQDLKEDWWIDPGKPSMRARPELVRELLSQADQPLLMMRSYDLLKYAGHIGVAVSDSTLEESKLVAEEAVAAWTPALVEAYVEILASGWPSHLRILHAAMLDDQDGSVARADVAEILGRARNAPLTGITRPYATAKRGLQARGLVPDGDVLMTPVFTWYEDHSLSHLCLQADLSSVFLSQMDVVERLVRELDDDAAEVADV